MHRIFGAAVILYVTLQWGGVKFLNQMLFLFKKGDNWGVLLILVSIIPLCCMKKVYLKISVALLGLTAPYLAQAQCSYDTTITTIAGNHTKGYSGDGGPANSAQMKSPFSIVCDASGNLYIADYFNHAVRKVNTAGIITTVAGTGTAGYNGDGINATSAQLNGPAGVAVDAAGNLYIADKFNERIRKVNVSTGVITTIAGNGLHGGWQGAAFGNGGPATAAALTYPVGMAFDCADTMMYIADQGSQTVRSINLNTGIIVRFAGTHAGGYNGDGIAATAAKLNLPTSIATDCSGNVYISDTWNNRIRKVNSSGTISTFAGTGTGGYTGDGGPATAAKLFGPWGIMRDACGDMYICDYDNKAVRKIDGSGVITTFAGNGLRGYTGDGAAATSARVYLPSAIAVGISNHVYVADYGNLVIRGIGVPGTGGRAFNGGTTQEIHVCQNDKPISIDQLMTIPDQMGGKSETWQVSVDPEHGSLTGFNATVESKGGMVTPSGLYYTPEADFTGEDEFTVLMSDGTTTASTTITVHVDPLPNAGAITAANIHGRNTVALTNSTADAGGVWTSSDETIATVSADGNVTAVTNGIVTIGYTVKNSCGSKTASANIKSEVTEIAAGKVLAFPNPNSGTFRCDFMSDADQAMTLIGTDITGRVVCTGNIQAVAGINTVSINLPATIQRPSIIRLSLVDGNNKKYETITVSVAE